MISAMKPSTTTSQSPASEPERADGTETGKTAKPKPYGDYHKPVIVKGMLKSPILPVWLSKRLSKLFKLATPTH